MTNILNKIMYVFVALILLTLSFFIIFGKSGLKDWWHLREEEREILTENKCIEKENAALAEKIYRLKHDLVYIEYIARHDFGMAARDELVFRFKKYSKKGGR